LFNSLTLKNGLYIEPFGNFSFLPVKCAIYMQDIFIKIGAYDLGPAVFNNDKWIITLAGLIFPDNVNSLVYTYNSVFIYFNELSRIKMNGWEQWVLVVKACIEEIEDYRGIIP